MYSLNKLFENNRGWAAGINERDPEFFAKLSKQQSPEFLWIGCSDSRVPANEIVGLLPGELFVHRNVANLLVHTDLNCLSVIQYAVEALRVKHIIVCGHYGCGGVKAALRHSQLGLIDNWLRHIQDIAARHEGLLSTIQEEQQQLDKLCELNVIEQVSNVCRTTIVQDAWRRGADVTVHGWIYRVSDGLLHNLSLGIKDQHELEDRYRTATGPPQRDAT